MANATTADDGSAPKKGGLMGALVPVLVLTLLAAGGGGLIGLQIVSAVKAAANAQPGAAKAASAASAAAEPERALKELAPVVTNLAAPDQQSWVRLQTAITFDKADAAQIDLLSAEIGDDILAYMRTLSIADLEGASGLQHLREDLAERAAIRSDGHVHDLIIEALVIQ